MNCPNCGAEMAERRGLRKVWYCSAECGSCIEDLNLAGGAHQLAGGDDAPAEVGEADRSSPAPKR